MLKKLISTNPARNYEKIDEVEISREEEIIEKVNKAQKAKLGWKEMSLEDRIPYFEKLMAVYKKRGEEVAEIQTKEVGKVIKESREDVEFDLFGIENNIRIAREVLKPEILDESETQKNILYFEPYGIMVVIVPWNFPSSNFFISCIQPLLAGNTIVFKHSEECPLTGKILEEIMEEAGFPEGVFSEVYGDGKVGDMLTNQAIDAIHFTGSTKIGRYLYEKAALKFIPATLEMGGSSPGIIFKDANLDMACKHALAERFLCCGQVCCALKRLIVHESIYSEVIERMKKAVESMKVGDPMDKNTDIGPLVTKRQLDLLIEQVEDAKKKGSTVITGGDVVGDLNGAFYKPTILTNLIMDMKVLTEEVFGPVLPILSFKTEKEAIELANKTIYGLSAFVYGSDFEQLKRVALKIEAGQISINNTSYFSDNSPFGGYKMSGIGRNSGKMGFYEVTQKKVVSEPVRKN
ncbi:aldehyde dehydrogenase family protein [Patescibacteria group bacterium]|nr:aldehyde dehydrogenase family protein [Patescibacteria group bacterium]MCG2701851.1 aldehyde dehydrogenase family protein [Candidatus Parcubacteria bacterium]MBU4265403.1 aldehyde dehydrogenase family protein [Patescibacteria group bacterium]MBU4390355.1 aldehyde dehydrogenase family protein [Patescibacteria group bacterium]MBU4396601.1 aldehyde dehydrogenase family protein [Patescibacteria group bacterium]